MKLTAAQLQSLCNASGYFKGTFIICINYLLHPNSTWPVNIPLVEIFNVAFYILSDRLVSVALPLVDEKNIVNVLVLFLNTHGPTHHGTQYLFQILFAWYGLTEEETIPLRLGDNHFISRRLKQKL